MCSYEMAGVGLRDGQHEPIMLGKKSFGVRAFSD